MIVETSLYKRRRNIFHRDDSVDMRTGILCRDTSRDDCRTPFRRDTSRDNCRNLLCREVSRDNCKILFRRYINSDDSTCTTVKMSSWRWCKISSCINTVRNICRDKIVLMVSCRY